MEVDTGYTEKVYSTKEAAEMLDMAVPTVRKYIVELERNGYTVLRSDANYRMFTEKDIMAVRYFNELREKSNIKVEQAGRIVMEKFGAGSLYDVRAPYTKEQTLYEIQHKSEINELKEMVQTLTEKVDQQQRYIENTIQARDEKLTATLREMQEAKKLEQSHEKEETDPVEKKGFFARLFKL